MPLNIRDKNLLGQLGLSSKSLNNPELTMYYYDNDVFCSAILTKEEIQTLDATFQLNGVKARITLDTSTNGFRFLISKQQYNNLMRFAEIVGLKKADGESQKVEKVEASNAQSIKLNNASASQGVKPNEIITFTSKEEAMENFVKSAANLLNKASITSRPEVERKKDYKEALERYKLAANQGHTEAQRRVAMFYNGYYPDSGIRQDEKQSFYYFSRVVEKKYDRLAYMFLAKAYEKGAGTTKDLNAAFKCYQKLASDPITVDMLSDFKARHPDFTSFNKPKQ